MGDFSRRELLAKSSLAFTFATAAGGLLLTPAQAREKALAFRVLSAAQARACETLAEALVPGAAKGGIAHYIDSQLAAGDDSLLMLKYLGVNQREHRGFYGAALDSVARELAKDGVKVPALAGRMAGDAVADWAGPPASFFYFVLRADALDVVYGTPAGFGDIGIPYRAHIEPPAAW